MNIHNNNTIDKALWKTSRNLIRDYSELELLQSGSYTQEKFVERSVSKTKEILSKELGVLNCASIQFDDEPYKLEEDGIHIIMRPIDGIPNLLRAMPFFATTIVQIERKDGFNNVIAAIMSFPALNGVYRAEVGQGAWAQTFEESGKIAGRRLRVSKTKEISLSIVSTTNNIPYDNYLSSRNFDCTAYDIANYTSGKIDTMIIGAEDQIHKFAIEIFAKESGGVIRNFEPEQIIATNPSLASFIK